MKLSRKTNAAIMYAISLVLAFAMPVSVFAEEATVTDPEAPVVVEPVAPAPEQPVAPPPAEPLAPAPAEPVAPVPPETYTYDAQTKKWNSNAWQWDTSSGKYVQVPEPTPATLAPQEQNGSSTTAINTADIVNALNSIATSGDATVKDNTSGGNATTGDTAATASIINSVNSSLTNANNKEAATFVMDIMGDVNGDIMLEPILLKAMLEAKVTENATSDINVKNDQSILNDVNLTASSGDATVSGNTTGGNATSGSANTVASVLNMVNSMIAANQSFDGTINIYGNLNGDILIAPDFIAQMLASNGIQASAEGATQLNSKDTQEIVNNVSLAAESGAALVSGNTTAGNATSGAADTNLVIFNMTGHEIVAANSLLIFINVLGSWVGVIVDAPVGATSAMLGNGVTQNSVEPSMVVDASNSTAITNNLNLSSRSGDAGVVGNTRAGNATSGAATASATIGNISNSTLGLTGWFGRLTINVFGKWLGSFGVNTSAGDPVQAASAAYRDESGTPQFMRFVPHSSSGQSSGSSNFAIVTPTGIVETEDINAKQAAATDAGKNDVEQTKSDIPTQQSYIDARKVLNVPFVIASLGLIVLSVYGLRRFLF